MLDDLRLRRTTEDGSLVLAIGGELDIGSAPRLREEITILVDGGCTRLVLDMGEVTFLDSSGLSVLIMGLKRLRERGGDLLLRAVNPQPRAVLEMTGITRLLGLSELGDEARPEPGAS